jgi:hypothetical protein
MDRLAGKGALSYFIHNKKRKVNIAQMNQNARRIFMGHFLNNQVMSGGLLTEETDTASPVPISQLNRQLLKSLERTLKQSETGRRKLRRRSEKLMDIESYLSKEIQKRKLAIFSQQSQLTRQSLIMEQQDNLPEVAVSLEERRLIRSNRLSSLDLDSYLSGVKVTPPGVQLEQLKEPIDHLSSILEELSVNLNLNDYVEYDFPFKNEEVTLLTPFLTAKSASSNHEEAIERQRLIDYGALRVQAENNYFEKRVN